MAETKAKGTAKTPATSRRKFKDIESNFVIIDDLDEPNHRPEIEGALVDVSSQTFPSQNGPQTVGRYKLQDDAGKNWTVLGSTSLDDLMRNVALGTYVKIAYGGTTKSRGGRNVKQYQVQVAE